MTKKHFILLADYIRRFNNVSAQGTEFSREQIAYLATFCKEANPQFKYDRWLGYISGTNGKNGGKVRP